LTSEPLAAVAPLMTALHPGHLGLGLISYQD
jgi:hypothetical protein